MQWGIISFNHISVLNQASIWKLSNPIFESGAGLAFNAKEYKARLDLEIMTVLLLHFVLCSAVVGN